ncbi:MAG: hypothetical protein MN733_44280, partial [Nitrososphaera sp.]|nr:hypothetical protein [Nitrososphaera sp.]
TIEFKFEKARVLSDLASNLTRVGNGNRATQLIDQALATAETEQHESLKVSVLSSVAQATSNIKEQNPAVDILNQAMTEAMAIERDRPRSYALNTILAAASQIGHLEQTQRILQSTLTTAQLAGRDVLFEALDGGALALVSLDQGETLWQVYKAVAEVETWWEPQVG